MRGQVSVLVAVISTAIVASFVIPMLLLVRTLAEDRGMAVASQQANTVAVLMSSLHEDPRLADLLQPALVGSPARTSVVLADDSIVGVGWPDAASDPDYQRARLGEAFSVRDDDGGRVYVPMVVDGGVAVVRASMTAEQLTEGVPLAWASILALGLLLSGIAVLVAAQAGRQVSRPLLAVADTAHRLRAGNLEARAPLAGPTETVELGAALNGLAERIEELLAAERETVRGLAHRLRTPVTALRLEAENVTDPDSRATLAELIGQLQEGIDLVVREARRPLREDLPGDCDAAAVVRERVDYWTPLAEDQDRPLQVSVSSRPLKVQLSVLALGDVVDICIDNVFAHTPEGTGFSVVLRADADRALLRIEDAGPGFMASTGETRQGSSGMGLRIARRIVEQGRGKMTISPIDEPRGRVEVTLPYEED